MRSEVELLKILRDNLSHLFKYSDCEGICESISWLYRKKEITPDEMAILNTIIKQRRPKGKPLLDYWWPAGKLEPRLKFLDRLIKYYSFCSPADTGHPAGQSVPQQ